MTRTVLLGVFNKIECVQVDPNSCTDSNTQLSTLEQLKAVCCFGGLLLPKVWLILKNNTLGMVVVVVREEQG